jgi:hypothetical protein
MKLQFIDKIYIIFEISYILLIIQTSTIIHKNNVN